MGLTKGSGGAEMVGSGKFPWGQPRLVANERPGFAGSSFFRRPGQVSCDPVHTRRLIRRTRLPFSLIGTPKEDDDYGRPPDNIVPAYKDAVRGPETFTGDVAFYGADIYRSGPSGLSELLGLHCSDRTDGVLMRAIGKGRIWGIMSTSSHLL
ncbi:hypothetical protein AVEN_236036-1 [Araneus ventricosus]|uniref:Uncharacterized protein n=1 Tax=Araneus ventricosus TaxID=182803 RepID=A0A4Y2LEV7_ARAVE|nr:hypothetical protein AVEN_236036-1 [Araneus ventricosus]